MTDDDRIGLRSRLERVQADRWNIDQSFRRRASDLLDTPVAHRVGGWEVKAEALLREVNANCRAVTDMRRHAAAEEHHKVTRTQADNRRKFDAMMRDVGDAI